MLLLICNCSFFSFLGGVQTLASKHKVWIHSKADSGNILTYYRVGLAHFMCYCTFLSNYLVFQGEVQEKARVLQTLKVNDVCNLH
jgi:hypothetical protein